MCDFEEEISDRYYFSHTARTQYRKFEANIPRKGTARPQSQFLHHVSVSDLYIHRIGLPILLQENIGAPMGGKI
jgi:hypothetical protein